MRHAPNMFAGSTPDATRSLFDEMPCDHEVFGEMPGAHMMFNDKEGTAYMSDLISDGVPGEGFQDGQVEVDEIEETTEVVDTDIGKTISKRTPWVGAAGTHHSKWKALEDECLIESWKAVSLDPITGANQTLGKYYARIDEFNEHRHIGENVTIQMNRNEGAISHRWSVIKTICNKFHGNLETVCNRNQSGKSAIDIVSFLMLICSSLMFDMLDMDILCSFMFAIDILYSFMLAMLVVYFIFALFYACSCLMLSKCTKGRTRAKNSP
jgi:hypothetical protein